MRYLVVILVICILFQSTLASDATGSVNIPLDVETIFWTWSVPLSGNWSVFFDSNLKSQTSTNLSLNVSEESSLFGNNSCTDCSLLNITSSYNNTFTKGDSIDFSAKWVAPSEALNWSEVFNNWTRFSHSNGEINSNPTEMNSWSYDSENDRILTTTNTVTYIGFVSDTIYTDYGLEATLKSTNGDNDHVSLVLAFLDNGTYQNTLSAVRVASGVGNYHWYIEYNLDTFTPESEDVIYDGSENITIKPSGWDDSLLGTKVKAVRTGNLIRVITTEFDNTTYKPETEFVINLSADERLQQFEDGAAIGFGAFSQADSTFEDVTISTFTSTFNYSINVSCNSVGCLCSNNSECSTGNCRSDIFTENSYCAEPVDFCAQAYNVSLGINERSGSYLCAAEDTSYECTSSNTCELRNNFYCTEELTWENSSIANYGCLDNDDDGFYDRFDTLIGNESSLGDLSNVEINITGSNSSNPEDVQNITIISENIPVIRFTHNFTNSSLNLSKIKLTYTSKSLIVNASEIQENQTKTVSIKDPGFISFCVRDAPTTSLSEFTSNCNATVETNFVSCLSNSTGVTIGNLTCIDYGNYISVSGLTHSALLGTLPQVDTDDTSPSRSGSSGSSSRYYDITDVLSEDGSYISTSLRVSDRIVFNNLMWTVTGKNNDKLELYNGSDRIWVNDLVEYNYNNYSLTFALQENAVLLIKLVTKELTQEKQLMNTSESVEINILSVNGTNLSKNIIALNETNASPISNVSDFSEEDSFNIWLFLLVFLVTAGCISYLILRKKN